MAIMDDLTANMDQQITLAFTSELQRLSLENQLKVQGFNVNTAISQPRSSMYGNRFGSLDPRRDINDECGFPLTEQITIQDLKYYWERESIANRVVNILPRESWRVTPRVYETEDKDTNTEFEKALDELPSELSGHSWLGSQEDNEGNPLWATLARLDELCGIGTFGLLLIGIDDGKELSEPIEGIDKNGDRVGKSGKRYKLTYLRVFDESAITITSYEDDKNCRRYKQPLTYEIDLGASVTSKQQTQHSKEGSVSVHWTRVIHVADNVVSSNLFGVPRMIPVINNLMNLRKLYGGDAEIWWKNASRSMILETHPQLGGKVKYNSATMKAELEKFNSGLQRDLITTGFNAKTLAPSAVDPSSHIDIQIDAICVQLETPKRIFLGSERGELASTQDADAWENRLKGRRNRHVTPRVTGPVINRFILIGVLPQPGEVFYIAWDPLEFMTPLEKAQIFSARMDGITKYIGGEAFSIISPLSILVRELGYTKEEALEELQAAEDAMEEADPPLAPKAQQQGENPFGGEAPSGEGGFDDTSVGEGMVPDERAGSTKSKRARFPYDRGKKLIEHHGVENHPGHPDQKVHGNRPGGKRGRGKDTRSRKRPDQSELALALKENNGISVYVGDDGWRYAHIGLDAEPIVEWKGATVILDSHGALVKEAVSRSERERARLVQWSLNDISEAYNLGYKIRDRWDADRGVARYIIKDPTLKKNKKFRDGITLEPPVSEGTDWRPPEMTGEDMSYIFHHPGHPDQKVHGNRPGGKKAKKLTKEQRRFIGPTATKVYEDEEGWTCIKYHDTEVVKFKDTTVVLDSGGWKTKTTKSRMNGTSRAFNLGFHVFQMKGEWYVTDPTSGDDLVDFEDGMTLEVPPVEDPDWRPGEMTPEGMSYIFHHPGHADQKSHGNWAHDGGEDSNGVKPYKSNVETYIEGTTKSTYTPVEGRGEFSAYIEQVMNYRAMSMIQKSSHYGSLVKGCNQSALYDELMKSNLGEFSFFDDRGKVGITNRGHAKAIFRDTIREFIEHVKYGKTDAVAFIGLEKSRRKFYKFLSSRASKYAPGWKGYQLGPGLFVVAKEEGHNWNKYFDNPLSVNALLVEHHHPGGKPHDQEKHGDWADDLEPKKKLSSKEEKELKRLEEREARRKARKERAKQSHKKSTKAKQDRGEDEQKKMSKIIGGVNDDDNRPFDVIAGRHGIEVKTVMDNKNNKITVHPESRRRKELTAKKYGLDMHTIVIDVRGGRRKYYYKAGVGAYRLSAMKRVSTREIKELFEER